MSEVVSKLNTTYHEFCCYCGFYQRENCSHKGDQLTYTLHTLRRCPLDPDKAQWEWLFLKDFQSTIQVRKLTWTIFSWTLLSWTFEVLRLDWWLRDVTLHLNSYRRGGSNTLTWPLVWRHGRHCLCTPFEGPDVTGDLFWLPKFLDHHVSSVIQKVPGLSRRSEWYLKHKDSPQNMF